MAALGLNELQICNIKYLKSKEKANTRVQLCKPNQANQANEDTFITTELHKLQTEGKGYFSKVSHKH